ncbi:MAG: hypothetical protein ABR573_10385 [Candidatus Dormibacteria bacterium]
MGAGRQRRKAVVRREEIRKGIAHDSWSSTINCLMITSPSGKQASNGAVPLNA